MFGHFLPLWHHKSAGVSVCLMANDTYVPITICIYLSGCVLALVCWPTSAAADFDLINVTLTNFGRNTVQRAQNGGGPAAWRSWRRGWRCGTVPVITIIKAISFSGSLALSRMDSVFPRNALDPLQYGLIIHAT